MYNVVIVQGVNNVAVEVNGETRFVWQDVNTPSELSSELAVLLESVGVNPTLIAESYFKGV